MKCVLSTQQRISRRQGIIQVKRENAKDVPFAQTSLTLTILQEEKTDHIFTDDANLVRESRVKEEKVSKSFEAARLLPADNQSLCEGRS